MFSGISGIFCVNYGHSVKIALQRRYSENGEKHPELPTGSSRIGRNRNSSKEACAFPY
jgi:hypothetical protein